MAPKRTNKVEKTGSNYHWTHRNVFTHDPTRKEPVLNSYTVDEITAFLLDKADKRIPSEVDNFASLTEDGNLNDSGQQPPFTITVIDYGVY